MYLKSNFYKRLLFTTALILSPYATLAMESETPSQEKHQASPRAQENSSRSSKRASSSSELVSITEVEDASQEQLGKRKRDLNEKGAKGQPADKKSKIVPDDAAISTAVVITEQFNAEEQAQNYWNDRNFAPLFQLLIDYPYLVNQPIHYTADDGDQSQMPLLAALEKIEDNAAFVALMPSIEGSDFNSDVALTLAPKEALLAAVVLKKNEAAQHILSQRPDLAYCVNKKGHTSMHLACLMGNQDMVVYLSKIAPDLLRMENSQTGEIPLDLLDFGNENMPLLNLFDQHHPDLLLRPLKLLNVRSLRANKILIKGNIVGKVSMLSILVASYLKQKQSLEVIRILKNHPELLREGFIFDDLRDDWRGSNIIHVAAFQGMVDVIQYALQVDNSAVYQLSKHQKLCTHYASHGGHLELLKLLLESYQGDLDLLSHQNKDGLTIFHFACLAPTTDVLEYLYQLKPALSDQADRRGLALLLFATAYGKLEAVKWLVQTTSPSDHQVQTLLNTDDDLIFKACWSNNPAVIAYLHSLSPTLLDIITPRRGLSPLDYAIVSGKIESARWLLDNIDPTKHSKDLLHLACESDDPQMLELIYSRKPESLSEGINYAQSPLKYALDQKKFKAARWILATVMNSSINLEEYIFAADIDAKLSLDEVVKSWPNQLGYLKELGHKESSRRRPENAEVLCTLRLPSVGVRWHRILNSPQPSDIKLLQYEWWMSRNSNPTPWYHLPQEPTQVPAEKTLESYLEQYKKEREDYFKGEGIASQLSQSGQSRATPPNLPFSACNIPTVYGIILNHKLTDFMEAILNYYIDGHQDLITPVLGAKLLKLVEFFPGNCRQRFIEELAKADKFEKVLHEYTMGRFFLADLAQQDLSVIELTVNAILKRAANSVKGNDKRSLYSYPSYSSFNAIRSTSSYLENWACQLTHNILCSNQNVKLLEYLLNKFPYGCQLGISKFVESVWGNNTDLNNNLLACLMFIAHKDIRLLTVRGTLLHYVSNFRSMHLIADIFPEFLLKEKRNEKGDIITVLESCIKGLQNGGNNMMSFIKLFAAAPEALTESLLESFEKNEERDSDTEDSDAEEEEESSLEPALFELVSCLYKLKPLLPPSIWKETVLVINNVNPVAQELYHQMLNQPESVNGENGSGARDALDLMVLANLSWEDINFQLLEICLNHLPVNRSWELARIRELDSLMVTPSIANDQTTIAVLERLKQIYRNRCNPLDLKSIAWQRFREFLLELTVYHKLTQADPLEHPLSTDVMGILENLWPHLPLHERLDTASPEEFAIKISAMLKRKN